MAQRPTPDPEISLAGQSKVPGAPRARIPPWMGRSLKSWTPSLWAPSSSEYSVKSVGLVSSQNHGNSAPGGNPVFPLPSPASTGGQGSLGTGQGGPEHSRAFGGAKECGELCPSQLRAPGGEALGVSSLLCIRNETFHTSSLNYSSPSCPVAPCWDSKCHEHIPP